jgi:hypothetical protein
MLVIAGVARTAPVLATPATCCLPALAAELGLPP